MNLRESEIEDVLRRAPQPRPPAGLKDGLIQQVKTPMRPGPARTVIAPASGSWLRRWWPALAPAAVSVACAIVISVQQREINDLTEERNSTANPMTSLVAAVPDPARAPTQGNGVTAGNSASYEAEIARLKQRVEQLKSEQAQLEKLRTENESLRAQIAAAAANLPPELQTAEALAKARDRAQRVACVNNLKQLGLAARIWANDNNDVLPPDILSMTNEMGTPKILLCPSDQSRQAAVDWAHYTAANCSYEFLAPSGLETEPDRVAFRCSIHNNIGLVDGSVQQIDNHPDWLIQRNGKLYVGPRGGN